MANLLCMRMFARPTLTPVKFTLAMDTVMFSLGKAYTSRAAAAKQGSDDEKNEQSSQKEMQKLLTGAPSSSIRREFCTVRLTVATAVPSNRTAKQSAFAEG